MRGLPKAALVAATTLMACRNAATPCVCTLEFRYYTVTVVDTLNAPVAGLTPAITVRSTGRLLIPAAPAGLPPGLYYVVTDGDLQQFALNGDRLHFAVSSAGRSAAADFVVDAPGTCHCHVQLVSGPDTLVLR
jgi:hypothetical protein